MVWFGEIPPLNGGEIARKITCNILIVVGTTSTVSFLELRYYIDIFLDSTIFNLRQVVVGTTLGISSQRA